MSDKLAAAKAFGLMTAETRERMRGGKLVKLSLDERLQDERVRLGVVPAVGVRPELVHESSD